MKIPYSKEDNTAVYFNGHSHFFISHYYEIRQAFKPEEYPKTESALTVLKNERAKTRFGYKEPPQEEKLSFFTRLFKSCSK